MKVFKDHSYLVFDMEDGHICKYDFATKQAYGFSGRPVKNISSQLCNKTVDNVINSCTQPGYGYFLKSIRDYFNDAYSNIGTLLDETVYFAHLEPFFTAGVKRIENLGHFRVQFRDVPTGLIRICREHDVRLSEQLVRDYKLYPDLFNVMYQLEYTTITDSELRTVVEYRHIVIELVSMFGYTPKALMLYIDRLVTFEAMQIFDALITLRDTIRMSAKISPKYDRYPRYLKTTHDIVQRNYHRMKAEFDKNAFEKRVNTAMERTIDRYKFIYPKTPQDIKDEAVQQNNCVASYIDRVINGKCDILFMRHADSPDKSLVTLEVINGKVVQKKQRYNNDTTKEQNDVIAKWETWYAKECA